MERILASKALEKIGKKIKLSGWVARVRDHGGLIFVDLRDWSGIIQLVIDPDNSKAFKAAKELGSEYVITVEGEVSKRDTSLQNANLRTGTIEVKVDTMEIVNTSKTPPLPLDGDGREIDEQTRLTYRYLDMRRGRVAGIMKKRHNLTMAIRNWMDSNEFTEITTPLLTSSSPEGARDFYVPSRLHKGKFFVLPQAPQQYKQLLMVGGVDKYFQIAPCARDEDPRADRHAGVFYQIDVEMSFPTIDKLFGTCENMIKDTYKAVAPDKEIIEFPFPRISYEDAMNTYGSDKPDLRFGLEVKDATEAIKGNTEFNVFESADVIKVINAPQSGGMSRKEIEEMEGYAKVMGAKGLAYVKVAGKKLESGIAKFLPAAVQEDIIKLAEAKDGDLLFFAADKWEVATKVMGEVRTRLGEKLELMDKNKLSFAWVTDFPFYEKDKDGNLDFGHNPFSMPKGGKEAFETDDPLSIISNQYDLAMNGYEILSGSIRNHDPEALVKAFEKVGYGEDEVKERFGGMYNAFQYGAPPHGGWAVGIDRYFMVLIDEPNIRDVYAFPKNSNGMDLMMNAPSTAPQADLDVLGIKSAMRGEEVASQILEKLEKSGAKYEYMEHKEVRTSQDAAEVRGSKLSDGAKSLVLHSKEYDDKYLMVVMPADKKGSLEKINKHMDEEFEVAKEAMINAIGLEVGGVPPFGRLLGMEVYFDQSMFKKKTSAFNIGTRTKSVVMGTKDLIKLAQPNKRSKEADLVV